MTRTTPEPAAADERRDEGAPPAQTASAAATSADASPAATPSRSAICSCPAVAWFLAVLAIALGADLCLKAWAFENVALMPVVVTDLAQTDHEMFWRQYPHDPIPVVPGVLELRLTTNTGAVFGLGKGGRVFFIIVSAIATLVIGVMFARSRASARLLHVALALILAGALGNLYDRVVYGAVRDMLHLFPDTGLWPWIFNLADAALMVGVGLVLLLTYLTERRLKAASRTPQPAA